MSESKQPRYSEAEQQEIDRNYHPVALKAVVAAALMMKRKNTEKKAA